MRLVAALLFAAATVCIAACGSDSSTGSGHLRVVATTTQVADLARNVAGARASVTQILTPNADPHDYEPRPNDARALAKADLVLRSGGDVDGWLGDVIKAAGADAREVTLADVVHQRRGDGHEEAGVGTPPGARGELDPHWWQDPRNAELAVQRIRAALVKADPHGRATYDANARRYLARLRALDGAIGRCMAAIPATKRKLVTNHDALGYFADRYDIRIVGAVIPALSTEARASAGETQRLVQTIRREGVTTIFPESSINPKLERAIAREAGATVGPPLWADALGPKRSNGATYLGSLRANAEAMAEGFTAGARRCDLPQ